MEVYEGSGNVFADMGLANPEERQAKATIALYIHQLISQAGWTQAEAASRMGLAQSDVSDIVRGKLRGFTLDRLIGCLTALGQDVEIKIHPKDANTEHARVKVACG